MKRSFVTLSRKLLVTGDGASPAAVLNTILQGMIQQIGPHAVGHAKAAAQVAGGIVHASTTGVPPSVEIKVVGSPAAAVDRLQVDTLCVFYGLRWKTLEMAWQEVLETLSRDGLQVTSVAVTPPPNEQKRTLSQAQLGIFASLLPSILIIKPCCLIPAVGSFLGGSMGTLHLFAALGPYRPLFMLASLGLLGSAFYSLYLRPLPINSREERRSRLTSHSLFWIASSAFVGAALFR